MRNDHSESQRLLEQARAGDDEALGRLLAVYRNYLKLLVRLQIGRRLRSKVDDSDLVQETCLDAHRHFRRFRGTTEAELMSWLRQILAAHLSNLVRDQHAQRRDVRLERELAAELDESSLALDRQLVARGSSPSQRLIRREQSVQLADALQELPADYREVIVLSHFEGLGYAEIARRMGRSVDSVKNLWARALAKLRRQLGERG